MAPATHCRHGSYRACVTCDHNLTGIAVQRIKMYMPKRREAVPDRQPVVDEDKVICRSPHGIVHLGNAADLIENDIQMRPVAEPAYTRTVKIAVIQQQRFNWRGRYPFDINRLQL